MRARKVAHVVLAGRRCGAQRNVHGEAPPFAHHIEAGALADALRHQPGEDVARGARAAVPAVVAAAVWMNPCASDWPTSARASAETMPRVTVWPTPKGVPIAST